MKLVTYFNHNMRFYWDNNRLQYIVRPREGPNSFNNLFNPIINQFWFVPGTTQDFIRPYMLFPNDVEQLNATAELMKDKVLCAQCTMYEGIEGETYTGVWFELDSLLILRELWDQLQEWVPRNDIWKPLPFVASVTIALK